MSFILDALKKSESERNRQSGPVLLEVRVAPPRSRLPAWAIVLGLALLANALVLGYLLLRPAPRVAAPAVQAAAALAPPAVAVGPVAASPAAAPTSAPPPSTGVLPDPALPNTPLPQADTANGSNAADFEPALPSRLPPPGAASAVSDMGLPTLNDLNASGANLPELHLSLHVYDAEPTRRYVLLNSTRLREGESTPDGIRLERVTESGVVLSWRNRRFTLQRGE